MLKIILKTKNEGELLEYWLKYHSKIVGWENLFIFDNLSDNPRTLDIYKKYKDKITLYEWSGNPQHVAHTYLNWKGYKKVINEDDCYLLVLDTDEFLSYYDAESGIFNNSKIIEVLKQKTEKKISTLWLNNTPNVEGLSSFDKNFIFNIKESDIEIDKTLGKFLLHSSHDTLKVKDYLGGFNHSHNCIKDGGLSVYSGNFCVLHLAKFNLKQRILNNVSIFKHRPYFEDPEGQNDLQTLFNGINENNLNEEFKQKILKRFIGIEQESLSREIVSIHKIKEVIEFLQNEKEFFKNNATYDPSTHLITNIIQHTIFDTEYKQIIKYNDIEYNNLLELEFFDFFKSKLPIKIKYKSSLSSQLPKNFNLNDYKKLNPDIANKDDEWLIFHYCKYGVKEGRRYNLNGLPEDFDPISYKKYNPDLSNQSDVWVTNHYLTYGIKENRTYKTELPSDFDYLQYRYFNKDIAFYTKEQLEAHYYVYGKNENRKYKDYLFDKEFFVSYNNIKNYENYTDYIKNWSLPKSERFLSLLKQTDKKEKSAIFLVNHLATLNGATHFIYSLYKTLKKINTNKKIYLLDTSLNVLLSNKYEIEEGDIISYENDASLLYNICIKLDPHKIVLNSNNSAYLETINHFKNKVVTHSHEIRKHYFPDIVPKFVVSERIQKEYEENNRPEIQKEYLSEDYLKILDKALQQPDLNILNGKLNTEKITIGMSGSLTGRKNFKLFKDLARFFSEYNFLWIGGDFNIEQLDIPNLFHIPYTTIPYIYYSAIDYFLLTSLEDPCPYVVLENLYMGNQVLAFKENIYTNHSSPLLDGVYYEYNGNINFTNAMEFIIQIVQKEKPLKNKSGKEYILKNFTNITDKYIEAII